MPAKKPTHLKLLQGRAKKDPQRFKDAHREPVANKGIGAVPKRLTVRQKAIWRELVKIAPAGVMGDADRPALEWLCKLVEVMRYDFKGMSGAQYVRLDSLLNKFGMTPAGRSSIKLPEKNKSSGFNDL